MFNAILGAAFFNGQRSFQKKLEYEGQKNRWPDICLPDSIILKSSIFETTKCDLNLALQLDA